MIKAANQLKTQFRVTFTGRHSGAIGGFHPVTEIYETDPRKDWNGWLREHYEKGDANHAAYKQRQQEAVMTRLKVGIAGTREEPGPGRRKTIPPGMFPTAFGREDDEK